MEEALYDSRAMRGLVRIDLGREPVPDETTVCRFRHLLERHDLGQPLFAAQRGLHVSNWYPSSRRRGQIPALRISRQLESLSPSATITSIGRPESKKGEERNAVYV